MFKSQKNVFWEALLVTVLIFGMGIFVGVVLENWRTSRIGDLIQQSDIALLDIRAQNEIYSAGNFNCEVAIQENLAFAERVYKEAQMLGRYEKAGRLTDNLKLQHKKYDILRVLLWMNSIKIKKDCRADYHNLVYLYDYDDVDIEIKARQAVFSKLLLELKEKRGREIMLIPMAGDNNLSSVSLLMDLYNTTESELPVILIDEKIKITEVQGVEDIEKLIK